MSLSGFQKIGVSSHDLYAAPNLGTRMNVVGEKNRQNIVAEHRAPCELQARKLFLIINYLMLASSSSRTRGTTQAMH